MEDERGHEEGGSGQRPAPKETKRSESLHNAAGNTYRYHIWVPLVIESGYVAVRSGAGYYAYAVARGPSAACRLLERRCRCS